MGAGASCAQGLPPMNSLTWELCEFLPEDDRKVLEQVIFEVFGIRRECGDASPNFEAFLNCLDPRSFTYIADCGINLSQAGRTQAIDIALLGLREYIRKKCISVQDNLWAYDRFVANLEPNATIVSFNWDVLLEMSLLRARKPFSYLPINNANDHILLLKPHGSINWFALLDREALIIDTTSNIDVIGSDLRYYLLYLKDPLGPVEMGPSSQFLKNVISTMPAIVPPSSSKLLDVDGIARDGFVQQGHQDALCKIWKLFYEGVMTAEEIVVGGYSLPGTDAASIEVLKAFFNHSRQQRVFIIDKNREITARYCNMVHPDARYVGEDFGTYEWTTFER